MVPEIRRVLMQTLLFKLTRGFRDEIKKAFIVKLEIYLPFVKFGTASVLKTDSTANFQHCRYILTQKITQNMAQDAAGLSLKTVLDKLNSFAPLTLAESWDNVGLIVEPTNPRLIKKILLTNDLTEKVVDEAICLNSDLIISYHPPIFVPLKSLTTKTWKERIIIKCIEKGIAVFSPHTSYDSIDGGVNDWMASAFETISVFPLNMASQSSTYTHLLEVTFPNSTSGNSAANQFQKQLRQYVDGCGEEQVCDMRDMTFKEMKVNIPCTTSALSKIVEVFNAVNCDIENAHLRIMKYDQIPNPRCGSGRMCMLKYPLPVSKVIDLVKAQIGIPHLRAALVPGTDMGAAVTSIAICVGSGSSVLRGVKADLYLTGEMLHHDILDAVHRGSHVVLCNHSDSERGFLTPFALKLARDCGSDVEVVVSKEDKDPIVTV